MVILGCQQVRDAGYISHTEQVTIQFKADWLAGESRNCTASFADMATGKLSELDCYGPLEHYGSGAPHTLSITFYGKTQRSDLRYDWEWRCVRHQLFDGFSCYALN